MTKYLAVVKDSFREALASRVLWLVLVLISLLLLLLAPLGYREVLTWRMGESDVRGWETLLEQVRRAGDKEQLTPARRIWDSLDAELQQNLATVKIPGIDKDASNPFEYLGVYNKFRKSLNKSLEERDFYQEQYFQEVPLLAEELRELRDQGLDTLSDPEVARFNRLLLEASFTDLVRASPPTSLQLKYAWSELFEPIPLRSATLREWIEGSASAVMTFFLGVVGVMVAILVTSPIVPQMFDPGSLHLLLSKPISRWLLFVAKFIGGCAFITICASYLIVGLWLILGARFGIWDAKLLLGIPIYLFVFAIYYSVSALVGVIFRSPIVCIVITVLFWGACFGVGLAKVSLENTLWASAQIKRVMEADESLIAVNEVGIAHQWDEAEGKWREIFLTREQKQTRGIMMAIPEVRNEMAPIGPAYDPRNDRLVSIQPPFPPPGGPKLYAADRGEQWDPQGGSTAPTGPRQILVEPDGQLLVVASVGLFRLVGDPLVKQQPVKVLGFELPIRSAGPLEDVGPSGDDAIVLTTPATAAINQSSGELAVYTRGTITLLRPDEEDRYEKIAEHRLDGKERQSIALAFGGSTLVLGRDDGRVQALDASTLEELASFQPEGPNPPRFVRASPDGRWFAVLFHSGRLRIWDTQTNELLDASVAGQGDISGASFSQDSSLYVADRAVRVTQYELPSFQRQARFAPKLNLVLRVYRYGVVPLYTIFPKPGELDTTFQYFLSGKETEDQSPTLRDLATAQKKVDPWTPLWSSALFTIVILVLACVYIEWQEF